MHGIEGSTYHGLKYVPGNRKQRPGDESEREQIASNFGGNFHFASSLDRLSEGTMSSFKKRSTVAPIPGTRPSSSSSLPLISTGLTTIDDLLGGGLPLGSSLLIAQDYPTTYSELLLRYFIAQGLESKQDVLVVSSALENGGPLGITKVLMGNDKATSTTRKDEDREDEEERKREEELKQKMKIAFRYETMKQHQTTLSTAQGENPDI